jgi:hypothetical protein
MARRPYMGLGLLFPRLLGLVHLWQFGDQQSNSTEPSGRQSGYLGEKWPLNFAYETFLFIPVNLRHGTDGFTSPPTKVVLRIFITSVGIEPANLGSSGEHANH